MYDLPAEAVDQSHLVIGRRDGEDDTVVSPRHVNDTNGAIMTLDVDGENFLAVRAVNVDKELIFVVPVIVLRA